MTIFQTLSTVSRRRLNSAAGAVAFMVTLGAVGIRLLENLTWIDSFYFAVETVTTVGYGNISPQTEIGKLFTTVYMLISVGIVLYGLTVLAQAALQSEVIEAINLRRKSREMENLKDHYIVCGAGRVGRRIVMALIKEGIEFVLIERDDKKVEQFADNGINILIADATSEKTLIKAGVERAHGLATCLADDASNVYVVLTARGLSEDLHIVARAAEEQAEPKLIRAGANRVIAPTIIGGQGMARALLKPAIADFMDSIVAENLDLVFEEVAIRRNSSYVGVQLQDTNISSELNLLVVAIRRKSGEMLFQPSAETIIRGGDLLIVIGNAEQMQKLVKANK